MENNTNGKTRSTTDPNGVVLPKATGGKAATDEQKAIRARLTPEKGLRSLASELGMNPGYLSRVMRGQRQASNRLRLALGLPPRTALAPVCGKCGVVHTTKRCTHKPTFEQREAEYDRWRAHNLERIEAIVQWAEQRQS